MASQIGRARASAGANVLRDGPALTPLSVGIGAFVALGIASYGWSADRAQTLRALGEAAVPLIAGAVILRFLPRVAPRWTGFGLAIGVILGGLICIGELRLNMPIRNAFHLRAMEFDDGISVPMHFLNPEGAIPLVPVTMNCTVPPVPTPERAYQVGTILRDVLKAYPGPERIAVIGTGGLSHEPGGPRYFWVDEEFDRWFLDLLKRGDHATLLRECTLERMEEAGSGGTAELLAWVLVMAFTRGPADVLAYMPAVAWRSGTGMVVWNEMAR